MTTERELREQEDKLIEDFLEDERNPYSWKKSKWWLLAMTVGIAVLWYFVG